MNRVAANLPARRSSSSEETTMEPDGLLIQAIRESLLGYDIADVRPVFGKEAE
jgi:hypothetical protein